VQERRTDLAKVKQEDFWFRYSGIEKVGEKEVREKFVHLSSFPEHLSVTLISLATMAVSGLVTYKGGPWYIIPCISVVSILSLTMIWRKNAKKNQ
jgi:hypothetical protein